MLTVSQRKRFTNYCQTNRLILSDRVLEHFFKEENHIVLLLFALDGDLLKRKELEERFRRHFFRFRFVKFIVTTIKFCTYDYIRLNQRYDQRNSLIYDRPISDEDESVLLGEILTNQQMTSVQQVSVSDPDRFQFIFINDHLANAFSALTLKQQQILTLSYGMSYKNVEIALLTGVSTAAVSKCKKLALANLRQAMMERR